MNPHDAQEKAVVVEEIEDFESVLDRRYGLGGHPNLVTGLDEDLPLELAQVLLLSVQTRNAAGGPVPDHDREEGPSPSTLTSSSGPTTSDDTVSPALQHLDTGASQAQDPPLPPHPTAPSEAWANDPGATRVPGRSLALPERRGRGRPRLPEEERVARIHASNRHAQARYRARQAAEVETMAWHLSRLRLAMAAARAEAAVLASERGALEHLLRAQDTFAETLLSAAQLPSHVIPPCRYDNPALSACQNAIMHGYCHLPRAGSRLATLAPAEAAQFCALSVEVLAERYAYNWMAVRDLLAQPDRDQSRAQFSMLIHAASIKGVRGGRARGRGERRAEGGLGWRVKRLFLDSWGGEGRGGSWIRGAPACSFVAVRDQSLHRHEAKAGRIPMCNTQSAFHWRVVHYRHNVYNQVNSLVMMGDPVIQLSLMVCRTAWELHAATTTLCAIVQWRAGGGHVGWRAHRSWLCLALPCRWRSCRIDIKVCSWSSLRGHSDGSCVRRL